jgi:queuosine precursor transporter
LALAIEAEGRMSELYCLGTFLLGCIGLLASIYFGRTSIFVYAVGCILVSNVTVSKQVEFFYFPTSLGIFIFSVSYLAINVLTEYWGRDCAIKLMISNVVAQLAFMTYSVASIATPLAQPADISQQAVQQAVQEAIEKLFAVAPRMTVAAIVSAIGWFVCLNIFLTLKKRYRKGWLALSIRNFLGTSIGNGINSLIFFVLAFYGSVPDDVLSHVTLQAIIVKSMLALLGTPFILLALWAKNKNPTNKTIEVHWASP